MQCWREPTNQHGNPEGTAYWGLRLHFARIHISDLTSHIGAQAALRYSGHVRILTRGYLQDVSQTDADVATDACATDPLQDVS